MVRFGLGRRRGRGSQGLDSCIPCVLRTRPLRCAKGRKMACFAFLWIPASAGMTAVVHPSPSQSEGEVLAVVFWRLF